MSDIESEYEAYESAKDDEGGLHDGRSEPSQALLLTVAIIVGLLVVGGIVLVLFG